MQAPAGQYGFNIVAERLLFYDPITRTYAYRVRSTLDPGKFGNTQLTLDGDTARVIGLARPACGTVATTLTTWIEHLHTTDV